MLLPTSDARGFSAELTKFFSLRFILNICFIIEHKKSFIKQIYSQKPTSKSLFINFDMKVFPLLVIQRHTTYTLEISLKLQKLQKNCQILGSYKQMSCQFF